MPPPEVLAPLAERWPAWRSAHPGLTWPPPERWHITIAYLGAITAGQRHRLSAALAPLASATAPLPARLAGSGAFPSPALARVLWVGLVAPGLEALAGAVRAAAVDARIQHDPQPFTAHITIARGRRDLPVSDVPHLLRKLSVADGAAWEITRLVLMESTGGPHPAYTERASWQLIGLIGDGDVRDGDQ